MWISADGRRWAEIRRVGGLFAPLARADSVAAGPGGGFDVAGIAGIRGSGSVADPVRQDPVVWCGRR